MARHELKIRKEYADAKAAGMKSFELREDDRGYAVGDRVTYRTVDELGSGLEHGLDGKEFEIVYILKGFTRGLKRNWVIWQEKALSPQSPAATAPLDSQGEPLEESGSEPQGEAGGGEEPGKSKAKKKG